MRIHTGLTLTICAALTALAGCGGDDHSGGSAQQSQPPTPTTTDFSTYAQSLVSTYSCETNQPAETNNIEFSFDAAQDTELPQSTDALVAQCQS